MFLIIPCIIAACSSVVFAGDDLCASYRNKTFAQRFKPLDSLYASIKTDTITKVVLLLNNLEACARDEHDEELQLSFRFIRYQVYISENHIPTSGIEDSLNNFLDLLDKKNYTLLKAQALVAFADYFWLRSKDYGPGFEYLMMAYNIYSGVSGRDFPPKSYFLYELAAKFYRFKDYNTAIRLLLEFEATEPKWDIPMPHNPLNLLGLCYRDIGRYDSAIVYFNEALKIAEVNKRIAWTGIIRGNIGISYYLQQQYITAIPLLEKDVAICMENKRAMADLPKSMAILADCYQETGQTIKALDLLHKVNEVIHEEQFWTRYDMLAVVYRVMSKVYYKAGQRDLAYKYFDSASIKRDSVEARESGLVLMGAQHKVDAERHIGEMRKLNAERELERVKKNAWLAGLILTSLTIILFINRQRIVHRRRSERIAAEKEKIETELNNATIMLNTFTRSVQEKNELIERFTTELERLSAQPGTVSHEEHNNTLLQLQESTILTDQQWEDFRRLFEKVHSGYLNRLKEKLPGLSPAETRIMALSKLKLSNKEMAGILGISADAVRMSKHRLRKKLSLSEEGGIDELAEMI